ncbi:flagellar hook protein FlgE [Mariniblastus fucicola]|uniref:Flagellar hook protein FlgE n=1 Tax=Mariniblastus fucicola TaxID=980251 RepID=A0A5B9PEQ2_9BACT|nr:flagellar hook-basal body complex protein [Mariniblastus fucicola]QEG23362.1 Flagellar hook protein FlgE [Mariniblastus fucicola]
MSALTTGVSGLRAHQQQLDVVANNLANMNTTGFKSQMAAFADLTYNTVQSGSGANDANGGVNPQQIGSGVRVSQISRSFGQGSLETTGELLDFAIQGEGFFVLEAADGQNVYSRAGSFSLDELGNLVDPATGFQVQRTGDVGESSDENFGFQVEGTNSINVPLGAAIPGTITETVDFHGNLPTFANPPGVEVLTSAEPYATTTGPADATTLLSDLTINTTDYVVGDTVEISGTNPDGTPFTASVDAVAATMQDLVDEVNSVLIGAVAELNPNGTLEITADETGEAFASLTLQDGSGNVGETQFARTSMVVSNEGTDGDSYEVSVELFDKRGTDHRVGFEFFKQSDNSWNLVATLESNSGETFDAEVNNIFFNEDGTFSIAGETGDGDTNIELNFDTVVETQVIELSFDNMNHMATDYSLSVVQDGSPPGTLVSLAVDGTGELTGLSSSGKTFALAQLSIASFANVNGLEGLGGNFYQESVNSGAASIGTGLSGVRGQVIGNQLEGSNVDLALEFTRLIVAQRGFSANARTITVADEVLEELTSIVR